MTPDDGPCSAVRIFSGLAGRPAPSIRLMIVRPATFDDKSMTRLLRPVAAGGPT
jgi:hypothetical protein